LSKKWIEILEVIILATVVIITMIVLTIVLDDKSQAALEVISYGMYLLVFGSLLMFGIEYRKNENARKTQIYVYSTQLLPMLKFDAQMGGGHGGKMVQNNAEYFYFFIAAGMFLFWSLLAGMLLDEEDRYIGLSLSSLAIIIIFIYILRNLNRANYIRDIDILQISWLKYTELQDQSIDYREKLNISNMNKEVIEGKF
jgi:hypothetical protein